MPPHFMRTVISRMVSPLLRGQDGLLIMVENDPHLRRFRELASQIIKISIEEIDSEEKIK